MMKNTQVSTFTDRETLSRVSSSKGRWPMELCSTTMVRAMKESFSMENGMELVYTAMQRGPSSTMVNGIEINLSPDVHIYLLALQASVINNSRIN